MGKIAYNQAGYKWVEATNPIPRSAAIEKAFKFRKLGYESKIIKKNDGYVVMVNQPGAGK